VIFPSARRTAFLVLISAMPAQAVWNGSLAESAPPGQPVVIELFTSQGCSSCPPADAILGELASKNNIVALGFHVDYWNGIGWRDPYSMPEATERQRRYSEALRLSSVFTPQIVIDGRRSLVGSDRQRIMAAIAQAAGGLKIAAAVEQDQLVIALPDGERGDYDVNLAAYMPHATTKVAGGENSGRTITDFNVVRQFRRIGGWQGKASALRVPLKSFPGDADHVAVWIQQANEGPIAGAVVASLH
jgi:hypothetical protein